MEVWEDSDEAMRGRTKMRASGHKTGATSPSSGSTS